jgi:hypothetical protein
MALTDLKVKAARPDFKPYQLTDGHGLFLAVQPNGSKLWRWKYRFQGSFRLMAVGNYPEISLANVSSGHAEARAKLLKGTDPMAERKTEESAGAQKFRQTAEVDANQTLATGVGLNSFRKVAALWFEKWKVGKV